MTRLAVLALAVLAAGCPSSDIDDYPIGGGGGGGGPSAPGRDAGTGDASGDGGAALRGRVCVVGDLRRLTNASPMDCRMSGASGLRVVLGGSMPVTTGPDGSFEMPVQEGTNLSWRVTGAIGGNPLIPSTVPLSSAMLLPAITDVRYQELLDQNGVVLVAGRGAVVARILRGGAPVMGLTAQIEGGVSQPRYDSNSPEIWGINATGPLGVAWIPDDLVGPRTLRISQGPTQLVQAPVTIFDGGITFVTIALPPL